MSRRILRVRRDFSGVIRLSTVFIRSHQVILNSRFIESDPGYNE